MLYRSLQRAAISCLFMFISASVANAVIFEGPDWYNCKTPHEVRTWKTAYKGRYFRVTRIPRCEHVEAVISYNPYGETLGSAKKKHGGIAVCTGSFHHPRTMALADFMQYEGSVLSGAKTGRSFVAIHPHGKISISTAYDYVKGKDGFSAVALGQRLVPRLEKDGFSTAFMNRVTDRMALGLSKTHIYIVQGRSDIWRLAGFMQHQLPVLKAVNCDGGHVIRGRAPVHLVFRWKRNGG